MEEYCKNCGAKVKNGAKFCKDCGSPIEYSDKTKGSLQNSSEDKHVCMNCGKELTGDEEFCTECGSPIGLKTVRAEDKIFCENCGTEMSADVDFCPECGFGKRHSVASTPSHSCRDRKVMYALIGFARSAEIGAFNEEKKTGLKKFGIELNKRTNIGRLLNIERQLTRFDKIKTKYEYSKSQYVVGTTTSYTTKAIFPKDWFNGKRVCEFEGFKFFIPDKSEKILEKLYGNYMELPPEDRREQSHFVIQ